MLKKIGSGVFSLSGAAILIGVIGGISSVVTIFMNTSEQVSVKWVLLSVILAVYMIIILLKIAHDAVDAGKPLPAFERPFKFVPDVGVFVIHKNENFVMNTIVGCYSQEDGIDRLAYIGTVLLIQSQLIQIKILADLEVLKSIPVGPDELKLIEIRPVVPLESLQRLIRQEHENG